MVKTGHESLTEFDFTHPDGPRLDVEVVEFGELSRRLAPTVYGRPHRVNFHQLTLVHEGSGAVMVDFVEHQCRAGMLVHVAPGQVQRLPYGADRLPAPIKAGMLLFTATSPPRLDRIARLTDPPPGRSVWTVPADELAGLRDAWTELSAECRRAVDDEGATRDLVRLLLGALLLRIARLPGASDAVSTPGEQVFSRFQLELERSFAMTRRATDYASRLGYAPRTLNRICHGASGLSAKQLIDRRVTLEAKRLLVHTDLPASTIASQLGFNEPTQFAKFFTRETGQPPGAFRRAWSWS